MALKQVLDTNFLIHLLSGRVGSLQTDDSEPVLSVISGIELLGWHGLDEIGSESLKNFLKLVAVIPLTEEIKEAAIILRRFHRLKTPDAIIVATAKVLNATLVTNDKKLHEIGVVPVRIVVVA